MDNKDLLKQFNNEIDGAFQAAWHSEKGGDEKWNSLLLKYGIQPLDKEYRDALLNSEMKIARGAFPIELRRVYEKIIEKHRSNVSLNQDLASVINSFDMDGKVKEYYQKIKPFSGMSDIFKNAGVGTQKYSIGLQKEKQYTIRCKNCAAPRLKEMQYDSCLFCGSKLFEPIV